MKNWRRNLKKGKEKGNRHERLCGDGGSIWSGAKQLLSITKRHVPWCRAGLHRWRSQVSLLALRGGGGVVFCWEGNMSLCQQWEACANWQEERWIFKDEKNRRLDEGEEEESCWTERTKKEGDKKMERSGHVYGIKYLQINLEKATRKEEKKERVNALRCASWPQGLWTVRIDWNSDLLVRTEERKEETEEEKVKEEERAIKKKDIHS